MIVKEREKWVDDVKAIACILVVLGHFFQSMAKASIISAGSLYEWFNTTIYYFHVPLFFICSGYLYQKYSKVTDIKSWLKNMAKKSLTLGVPYVTFTTITWMMKTVFSSNVNEQIGGLHDILFFHPTAPYWYLYALFFIFLVTPTFWGMKMAVIGLAMAMIMKLLAFLGVGYGVYVVSTVFSNEIWFVLGMSISAFNVKVKDKKLLGTICGLFFVLLSIVVYMMNIQRACVSFVLGIMACVAVLLLVAGNENKFGKGMDFITKYTMPIFLMHTLFAAPLRIILLKVGVTNAIVHVLLGLLISFFGPIVMAVFAKKTKWLEFFWYPGKFLL